MERPNPPKATCTAEPRPTLSRQPHTARGPNTRTRPDAQAPWPTPPTGFPTPTPSDTGVMPFSLAVATTGPVGAPAAGTALVPGRGVRGDSGALVAPRRPTIRTEREPPGPPPHGSPGPGDHDPAHEPPPTSGPRPHARVPPLVFSLTQQESRPGARTSTPRAEPVGGNTPAERHQRPQQTSNGEVPSNLEHLLC